MDDILKELGWDDGFRIPVANEENKALELEVQKKQKEKENLKFVLEDITEHVEGMKKYLKNVYHQIDQNENLIFAHNNQKSAEENLVILAKVEENSMVNDIKKIKKEQRDVLDRQNTVQMEINKLQKHIEELNATIKWDKEALLAWDEEVCRGDDDTYMLEKFKKEDEAKFKELELKRQCLSLEVENKRSKLINLKNDVLSMEQSLEKTAQMFRKQHYERRVLVQQWEGSVRILQQRDEDINRCVEELRNLKCLAKERVKDLEEQKDFFRNEQRNNEEVEKQVHGLSVKLTEGKEKIRMIEAAIADENEKLSTLKTVLSTTTTQFHKDRNLCKSLYKEMETKNNQLEAMRHKLEKSKDEYERAKNKKVSSKDRVDELEKILKEEEKNSEKNLAEFKKLDELMFQVEQQIIEMKNSEKGQIASVGHIESCKTSIRKKLLKAKSELNRQKEILYHMDFAYMEKEILLNRVTGVIKDEDSEKQEKRISELERVYSHMSATNALLTKEIMRLEEDMRRLTLELSSDNKEENHLKNKRQDNVLVVECGQKQVKALRVQNENKQVDENLLRLRVRQAELAIKKEGGKVFSLEKQRMELEEAMKEREIEIKTMRDILNVRRRVLIEQTSNLNSRINLGKVKVEHLKNKYDVALSKLGKDDQGETLSVTHVKLQAAQERFELQDLGDKLDIKIKKTEKEIEAMENTLKVVNATNKAFKNNLQAVDANAPENEEKEKLEEELNRNLEEYRQQKSVFEGLDNVTVALEYEFQQKLNAEENIRRMWDEKDQQLAEIDKELKEQEEKLERADGRLKKLIKEIRGTKIKKFETIEEKDIELRELMEQNEYGLQQLAELVAKTYDTGPVVIRYLSEKGLSLPMIKSPSSSIKYSSSASLLSPGRSSVSLKSSRSASSKTSSILITPSVITLDSEGLGSGDSSFVISRDNKSKSNSSYKPKKKKKHLNKIFPKGSEGSSVKD